MNGVEMSEAFASTLRLSFEVRGGLLMRQIHHWAALIFMAAIVTHMMRVFFTGRVPQAARGQLGRRLRAADPRPRRRLLRLLAPRRRPLRQRPAHHRRRRASRSRSSAATCRTSSSAASSPGQDLIPRLFTVHILLVPGPHPRAHRAAPVLRRAAQAHAVPGLGPHRQERRRLPALPGLRGEGRRLLLHRVRRHRADGRDDDDQPGLELRPVRPVTRLRGCPARLVHALPRGRRCASCRVQPSS